MIRYQHLLHTLSGHHHFIFDMRRSHHSNPVVHSVGLLSFLYKHPFKSMAKQL
jgi:hypothetical protein